MITALLAAIVTGAALGMSGAALQSVLRNPIAEPYVLGLVGGASLGVALAYATGMAVMCPLSVPVSAFAGAAFSLALVCVVARFAARRRGGAFSGGTVIVAGFVTGSFTNSLQMLVLSRATSDQSAAAMKWVWGDLATASPTAVGAAGIAVLASFILIYSLNRSLNALELGDDAAAALGVVVRRTRLLALVGASLATAAAVAAVGAVGFVGLVAPHFARRLFGGDHRALLPVSAALGAVLLMGADLLSRAVPGGIPTGVTCALLGAPVLMVLLVRSGRGAA